MPRTRQDCRMNLDSLLSRLVLLQMMLSPLMQLFNATAATYLLSCGPPYGLFFRLISLPLSVRWSLSLDLRSSLVIVTAWHPCISVMPPPLMRPSNTVSCSFSTLHCLLNGHLFGLISPTCSLSRRLQCSRHTRLGAAWPCDPLLLLAHTRVAMPSMWISLTASISIYPMTIVSCLIIPLLMGLSHASSICTGVVHSMVLLPLASALVCALSTVPPAAMVACSMVLVTVLYTPSVLSPPPCVALSYNAPGLSFALSLS